MCSFLGTCKKLGPVAQLVRAPPCHGGGQGFEPLSGRLLNNFQLQLNIWGLSSAGRASALQAEGHRFEPYRSHINHGWIPEWPKGADCKSVAFSFDGSNPSSPTKDSIAERRCFFYFGFFTELLKLKKEKCMIFRKREKTFTNTSCFATIGK